MTTTRPWAPGWYATRRETERGRVHWGRQHYRATCTEALCGARFDPIADCRGAAELVAWDVVGTPACDSMRCVKCRKAERDHPAQK